MRKLKDLSPERVFFYFEEISKIPRESGNEKAISNYLVDFAKKFNLEFYQDKNLNVIIRKKASKGYENSDGIVLQAHIDMVCEKEKNSNHNFLTDPIDLIVDGNLLMADKTTLGADNGIGVAMALAILEDENLSHPQIEFLATTEEETTMNGALTLEENKLSGTMLINIDSEEEGRLTAGSAGGLSVDVELIEKQDKIKLDENNYNFYKLEVSHLKGGHSGVEINSNRSNANKVLVEFLKELYSHFEIYMSQVFGGTKDNAIPRSCFIEIAIKKENRDKFVEEVFKMTNIFKEKYENEKEMQINLIESDYKEVFSRKFLEDYLNLITELPTGVNTMMKEYENIVESSDNLAIIKTIDNKVTVKLSLRSSNPKVLNELADSIVKICEKNNAIATTNDGYPEWVYRNDSKLRDKAVEVYKKMFNEDMEVTVIHAGLECGAISQVYKNMDMISIGPNMYDVHTPKERLEIKSVDKYYSYLKKLIEELR